MKLDRRAILLPLMLLLLMLPLAACSPPGVTEAVTGNRASGAPEVPIVGDASDQENTDERPTVEKDGPSGEAAASPELEEEDSDEVVRPAGWGEQSHDKSAEPDYEVVFSQDEVIRIDIAISPENWQAMLDDMTELYGEQGEYTGPTTMMGGRLGGRIAPQDGGIRPPGGEDGFQPPEGEGQRPMPGGAAPGKGMPGMDDTDKPSYVPSTVMFEGDTWEQVGIRFRGNSTLRSSWSSGNLKLSFKLDFDEYEDDYPELDDQRFFGFKQLVLVSNAMDSSLLREKVTADIFRQAGLVAPTTAFCTVYLDYGDGPLYLGVYTLVEVVDDTVIETQFEDDSGNVYKPEGIGATFAAGSFGEASFEKQTNQEEADWSDIEEVFAALHSELRTSDPAAWRSNLEAVFDVDTFLHWLAVNTIVQNWDTYGVMNHNYYLYTDPATGQVTWIPWDNNMALSSTMGMGRVLSLGMDEVTESWPLIRYLMDDEVYHQVYVDHVRDTIENAFEPEALKASLQAHHDLIKPYVSGENGEIGGYTYVPSAGAFEEALEELHVHVDGRVAAAEAYLATH